MHARILITVAIFTAALLAPTATAQIVYSDIKAYGTACGNCQILPDHALIGKNFVIVIKSKDAKSGLLVMGTKRTKVDLGKGCTLYTNILGMGGWVSPTKGKATISIAIPNTAALLGLTYMMQVSANNTLGLGISRGIEFKIGNKKPAE